MKDYKEIADTVIESTVRLKRKMTEAGFHMDIRHSVVENFANSLIEYEFSEITPDPVKLEKALDLREFNILMRVARAAAKVEEQEAKGEEWEEDSLFLKLDDALEEARMMGLLETSPSSRP